MKTIKKVLKWLVLPVCIFMIYCIIQEIYLDGVTFTGICVLLLFTIMMLFIVFENRLDRYTEKLHEKDRLSKVGVVKEDYFYFPSGYFCRHSTFKNKKLYFNKIQELRTNTLPISAKINSNELIFLHGFDREDVLKVAEFHKILIIEPQDNWELICMKYLDTEFNDDDLKNVFLKLNKVNISNEEIKTIQKKIGFHMYSAAYFSLEWIYFGQFDVLRNISLLSKKNYWKTMDIALRQ